MKVMQRGIMKILPGKMAEAMEAMQEHIAIMTRSGMPQGRLYQRFFGLGDVAHTFAYEFDLDSFAAMEALSEKAMADPEMPSHMAKMDAIVESHEVELYMAMPTP